MCVCVLKFKQTQDFHFVIFLFFCHPHQQLQLLQSVISNQYDTFCKKIIIMINFFFFLTMFKLLREQIQTLQNNTHPKLELPRVSTVLIAAVRPESGPSKHPFCPSNWSQIGSFFLWSVLSVCDTVAVSRMSVPAVSGALESSPPIWIRSDTRLSF